MKYFLLTCDTTYHGNIFDTSQWHCWTGWSVLARPMPSLDDDDVDQDAETERLELGLNGDIAGGGEVMPCVLQ